MAALSFKFAFSSSVRTRAARALETVGKFSFPRAAATTLSSRAAAPSLRSIVSTSAAAALRAPTAIHCTTAFDPSAADVVQIKIEGMMCDGCTSRVLEVLQKFPGVKAVQVDLEGGKASVQLEANAQAALPGLIDAVKDLGFEAQPCTA